LLSRRTHSSAGAATTPEQAMQCCNSMPCSSHGHEHSQDCCKTTQAMHRPFVQPSSVHCVFILPSWLRCHQSRTRLIANHRFWAARPSCPIASLARHRPRGGGSHNLSGVNLKGDHEVSASRRQIKVTWRTDFASRAYTRTSLFLHSQY